MSEDEPCQRIGYLNTVNIKARDRGIMITGNEAGARYIEVVTSLANYCTIEYKSIEFPLPVRILSFARAPSERINEL